ncbi:HEAT repeat-containing protein 1 homolog [Scaptodrosophila lebanonensis]|uniref:HEAT repeat-containing protein 1 n=1 Tax=Drosophila lebanonensis TaxID=7225 RepID=A0A6J2TMS4_DROLE|nr:HEAT repeat-containing protein 1 homolog [Scaptodrosophila lebanonensis]
MATSLAQQLRKLQAPQTSIQLADAHSRASILFDPKEAANKDRREIFDIASSGLLELQTFNPAFKQFELTLFDEASITMERAVETAEVNKLLDLNIAKFLQHLSPYFLLRPAHMCFEWLLRRFQVHVYNRDDVMALILPYHETNTFVQVLQTMKLRDCPNWDWLGRLQRPGVTLAKSAIINRASSEKEFLNFICRSTQRAVKEMGPRAHQLQTQLNFYSTVVVGVLQVAEPVKDWHITSILESLLRGLRSGTLDFVAASFVILAQLVLRTKLKMKICNVFLERVANCTFERLHKSALQLLILILDKQQSARLKFQPETMLNLVRQRWLIPSLVSLTKENIAIQAICMPLVSGAVLAVRKEQPSSETYQQFLNQLLVEVPLSQSSAEQIINCFLDNYVNTDGHPNLKKPLQESDNGTILLDSDDEMEGIKSNFRTWYTDYLAKLERSYPVAFDMCVKEALASKQKTSTRQQALRLALGFRLNTTDDRAKVAYEKLYHYNADWRLSAVKSLLKSLQVPKKRERSYTLLQQCLADRIKDDSAAVVGALLSELSTADFVQMLGPKQFAQTLCELVKRAQLQREEWLEFVPQAVQHLTSGIVSESFDNNLLLLALMPYLFPSEATLHAREHEVLLIIVNSEFCAKVQLLKNLQVNQSFEKFNVGEHRQHFLDIIASEKSSKEQQSLSAETLLQSVEAHGGVKFLKEAANLTHLLLLLTAYAKRKLNASEALNMLEKVRNYSHGFELRMAGTTSHNNHNTKYVSLELFADFMETLTGHVKFEELENTNWTQPTDELRLCLLLLDDITARIYDKRASASDRQLWLDTMKQVLNFMLPQAQQKFDFLSNFYVYDELPQIYKNSADYALLRVRGFMLLQAVLKNNLQIDCKLEHVLRLSQACASPLPTLRTQAVQTLALLPRLEPHVAYFVESLLARRSELTMDHEQYALIMFTILEPGKQIAKQKLLLAKLRREYFALISDAQKLPSCTAALLRPLKHVNNEEMLGILLPLAHSALEKIDATSSEGLKKLESPYSNIYQSIVERFEGNVAVSVLQRNPEAWNLFELSFAKHDVYIQTEQKLQPLPCVLLNTLTPETFERMQAKHKVGLIKLIIQAATQSDNDSIFLAAHKLLKRCIIECQPLVPMLSEVCSQSMQLQKPLTRSRRTGINAQLDLSSLSWKQGMTLLELLEHKKHLLNAELLIPALFGLLQACLELEEHSAAEHPKQLILSCLLHCCQTAETAGVNVKKVLPESCFRIELVVQCLRNTQNPQTQQHALLFLTRCADLYPQQVLHKIVEIFTFVGSTVARNDDAFSLHIINNVVLSIIPTLLQQPAQGKPLVVPVLKVFSDICIDVPLHRRLPLYATLFSVLEPKRHLWQFLCIVLEAQTVMEQQPAQVDTNNTRLEFARELTLMFDDPELILETCVCLLDYLAQLPTSKSNDGNTKQSNSSILETEQQLFDVRTHSFKQLRHYMYLITDYLCSLSGSTEFKTKLDAPTAVALQNLKPFYQDFILKTLGYVTVANNALLSAAGTLSLEKYWRVIGNHAHDILNNAIGLLSPEYFLSVITELLQHEIIHVRIKVLELLADKLQANNEYFSNCDSKHFGILFAPLVDIVDVVLNQNANNAQQAQLQQSALHAIQLLAQRYGREYITECRSLLATLTRITKMRSMVPKAVVGNVLLTLVEICASLKAHALAQLPKFMPQLTEMLKEQLLQPAPDYLCSALITAIQKLFVALPLFLAPYLVDIITPLAHLSTQLSQDQLAQDKRAQALQLRIDDVWLSIAKGTEVRVLVPSCAKVYANLLDAQSYDELSTLMKLLLQCLKHNNNAQLQPVQSELGELFLQALEFRLHVRGRGLSRERVDQIEAAVIEAFVHWILKLSETSFRPMYSKVYKWALQQNEQREPMLTYFLLTNKIAEALKSLFVIFADNFIQDAARLLHEHNMLRESHNNEDESLNEQLVSAILSTLQLVFQHSTNDFLNSHRFNTLMQPIVDQLENELVLSRESLQQSLTTCIAQLAVAVSNDVHWKQLNTQVLLKTRIQKPDVKILAFNTCVAIAQKLGESFAPLLPETVPFIAELLEDEHDRVEKNTRSAVQQLESILGEPVQKYL